ncbi:unnamed protein product [Symbiodinium microadriaticum]|nr:unnamed protein product [Symbiodinium microadriaticum]
MTFRVTGRRSGSGQHVPQPHESELEAKLRHARAKIGDQDAGTFSVPVPASSTSIQLPQGALNVRRENNFFAVRSATQATQPRAASPCSQQVQQCPLQQVPFTQAQMVQPRHGTVSPTASQGSLQRAPRLSWPPSSQGHPSVPSTPCTPSPKPLPCQGSQTSRTSREGAPTRLVSSAMSPSRPAVQGQGMLSSPPSRSDILSDGSEVPSRKTLPSGVRLQVSTQEDAQHGLQVQSVMVTKRNERSTEDLQKEVGVLTNLLHQERRQANDAFNKLHNKWSCDLRANEDFIKYLHNEKDRMQEKLEGLENERKGVIAQWQQLVGENEDLRKELRTKNRQLEGENSDLKEALTRLQNRLEELNSFEHFAGGELEDAKAKVADMADELAAARNEVAKLQKENASLQKQVEVQRKLREDEQKASEEKNRRWARECSGVGAGTGEEAAQSPTPELATSSENRLRMAMIDSSSSSTQLKDAISAVESLLGEAKRELKNKQLRERRAAFEQLHAALEANDEHALAQAVEAARTAEVEAEDVAKAEAKLVELQSRTDDDRKAQAAQVLLSGQKKDAFHYVKKDNVDAVKTILESLDDTVRWQDWRDYCGRTLQSYAREMKSDQVSEFLTSMASTSDASPASRSALHSEKSRASAASASSQPSSVALDEDDEAEAEAGVDGEETSHLVALTNSNNLDPQEDYSEDYFPSSWVEEKVSTRPAEVTRQVSEETEDGEEVEEPEISLSQEEVDALKKEAFRNVVQNKMQELDDVLAQLPVRVWSCWENKAGKDLITLSQERGSSGAYCILAKRLGIVQELKKDSFEEREDVWVFLPGEVQPLRATVLEDTPEEQDDVLIQYWDGDEPEKRIEKCLVRKIWG